MGKLGGVKEDLPDWSERIAWPAEEHRAGEELVPMSVPPVTSQRFLEAAAVYTSLSNVESLPSKATWKDGFNSD